MLGKFNRTLMAMVWLMPLSAQAGSVCIVNNTTLRVSAEAKGRDAVEIPAMTSQMITGVSKVHVLAAECPKYGWACTVGQNHTLVIHPSRKPTKARGIAQCS